jgi:putative endonuclease
MEKMNRVQLAKWGENIARIYLENQKIQILTINFRTRHGEIDIIGKENEDIVFIEVKTRSSKTFGFPEEAVDQRKIAKIELVANEYLDLNQMDDTNWRIDTIAIIRNPYNGKFELEWFKNVGY